jgi:multidrug efflux pump subunit AcrA (membrane-fusion protein)
MPSSSLEARQPLSRFKLALASSGLLLLTMPLISYGISSNFPRIPNDGFSFVEQGNIQQELRSRGELQSSQNAVLTSRCEWRVNLLWIAEEGTQVEAGDVIAVLDSSVLEQKAKEREILLMKARAALHTAQSNLEIQELTNQNATAAAALNAKLKSMELDGFRTCQSRQEVHASEGRLAIADAALIYAQEKFEFTKRMAQRGYKDYADVETDRIALVKAQQTRQREEQGLKLLTTYQHDRRLIELTAQEVETRRALKRAELKANASLIHRRMIVHAYRRICGAHENALKRIQRSIAACTIRAQQPGEVVHVRASSRAPTGVQPGELVRYLQPLVQLPDRSKLEVLVRLHESLIRQIEIGQPALITTDAVPDVPYSGHVTSMSTVPQRGAFPHVDLRDYWVVITLEDTAESQLSLAPGMSATAQILVNQKSDAVIVPLECVVHVDNRDIVFVRKGDDIEVRDVQTGLINETKAEIAFGVNPGEEVVSRPREACAARIASLRAEFDEAGSGSTEQLWLTSN